MTDTTSLRGDESGDLIVRIPISISREQESWELPTEYLVVSTGRYELLAHTLPPSTHGMVARLANDGELEYAGEHNVNSLIRDTAVHNEATDTYVIPQPDPTPASEAYRLRAALEEVRDDLDGLWVNAGDSTPVGEYLQALHARVAALLAVQVNA
jgi:hypothetical protein